MSDLDALVSHLYTPPHERDAEVLEDLRYRLGSEAPFNIWPEEQLDAVVQMGEGELCLKDDTFRLRPQDGLVVVLRGKLKLQSRLSTGVPGVLAVRESYTCPDEMDEDIRYIAAKDALVLKVSKAALGLTLNGGAAMGRRRTTRGRASSDSHSSSPARPPTRSCSSRDDGMVDPLAGLRSGLLPLDVELGASGLRCGLMPLDVDLPTPSTARKPVVHESASNKRTKRTAESFAVAGKMETLCDSRVLSHTDDETAGRGNGFGAVGGPSVTLDDVMRRGRKRSRPAARAVGAPGPKVAIESADDDSEVEFLCVVKDGEVLEEREPLSATPAVSASTAEPPSPVRSVISSAKSSQNEEVFVSDGSGSIRVVKDSPTSARMMVEDEDGDDARTTQFVDTEDDQDEEEGGSMCDGKTMGMDDRGSTDSCRNSEDGDDEAEEEDDDVGERATVAGRRIRRAATQVETGMSDAQIRREVLKKLSERVGLPESDISLMPISKRVNSVYERLRKMYPLAPECMLFHGASYNACLGIAKSNFRKAADRGEGRKCFFFGTDPRVADRWARWRTDTAGGRVSMIVAKLLCVGDADIRSSGCTGGTVRVPYECPELLMPSYIARYTPPSKTLPLSGEGWKYELERTPGAVKKALHSHIIMTRHKAPDFRDPLRG